MQLCCSASLGPTSTRTLTPAISLHLIIAYQNDRNVLPKISKLPCIDCHWVLPGLWTIRMASCDRGQTVRALLFWYYRYCHSTAWHQVYLSTEKSDRKSVMLHGILVHTTKKIDPNQYFRKWFRYRVTLLLSKNPVRQLHNLPVLELLARRHRDRRVHTAVDASS
jgi:hypothetical protein